jgi:hypothetical protein
VADINGALQGRNIEAARGALRGPLGNIPVFKKEGGRRRAYRSTRHPC